MKKFLILLFILFIATASYGADTEVQDLDAISSPASGDMLYIVDDPTGTPASKHITLGNLLVDGLIPNDITIDSATAAGTATVATTVTITDNESTAENNPIVFVEDGDLDGGNLGLESDGTCYYTPSTGVITTTGFAGALTGNVTGDCSGNAGTATALASNPTDCDPGEFANAIDASGNLTCAAPAGSGDVTSVGDCTEGACLDGSSDGGTNILFYDADGATTITVGNNTGAVALSLPIVSGTLLTADGVGTALTALNGENIQDNTIDDDSIDFGSGADQVDTDDLPEGSTNKYVTAANVGAVSANLDDVDASIEWEDATDLESDGSVTWGNLAAGELNDDSVQADDIDLTDFTCADLTTTDCGAITSTSKADFGGGDLEIPNGADVADPNAAGEVAIDTTSDQFLYYGGAQRVLRYQVDKSFTIEDLAAADDGIPFGSESYARTVTQIGCRCIGTCTTAAEFSFSDSAANAFTLSATPTCATTGAATYVNVTAGGALVAGEGMLFNVTNAVSPETDWYEVMWVETITAD